MSRLEDLVAVKDLALDLEWRLKGDEIGGFAKEGNNQQNQEQAAQMARAMRKLGYEATQMRHSQRYADAKTWVVAFKRTDVERLIDEFAESEYALQLRREDFPPIRGGMIALGQRVAWRKDNKDEAKAIAFVQDDILTPLINDLKLNGIPQNKVRYFRPNAGEAAVTVPIQHLQEAFPDIVIKGVEPAKSFARVVEKDPYETVKRFTWHQSSSDPGYVSTVIGGSSTRDVEMHRERVLGELQNIPGLEVKTREVAAKKVRGPKRTLILAKPIELLEQHIEGFEIGKATQPERANGR